MVNKIVHNIWKHMVRTKLDNQINQHNSLAFSSSLQTTQNGILNWVLKSCQGNFLQNLHCTDSYAECLTQWIKCLAFMKNEALQSMHINITNSTHIKTLPTFRIVGIFFKNSTYPWNSVIQCHAAGKPWQDAIGVDEHVGHVGHFGHVVQIFVLPNAMCRKRRVISPSTYVEFCP